MSSYSTGSNQDYDGYFALLQNACIRYDKGHKSTLSAASRALYQHGSQDYHPSSFTDHADTGIITGGIDIPESLIISTMTEFQPKRAVSTLTLMGKG